jgi:hypothetical protein
VVLIMKVGPESDSAGIHEPRWEIKAQSALNS